jgi:histone H3/H4
MSKTNETPITPVVDTSTFEVSNETSKFIVVSQIKALIRSKDCCVGGDLIDALSTKVKQLVETAIARAEANNRKTIRSSDL